MITPFEVYLVTELDYIVDFFSCMATFITIASIISIIYYASKYNEDYKEGNKELIKLIKLGFFVGFFMWLSVTLIPGTNQMATIIILPAVANSQFIKEAQNIPTDLTKLAEKYIQDKLIDTKGESK